MPIQDTSIELIQQAGQTLHRARQALEEDVQASAHLITASILQASAKDLDQVFTGIKEVARLVHDLQSLEGRLKDLYLSAVSIAEHRSQRVPQLAQLDAQPAKAAAQVSDIQDVEPKEPKSKKRATTKTAAAAQKTAPIKVKAKAPIAPKPERLSNDQKLLAFFKTTLNAKAFTKLTGRDIVEGAGLPAGSVSASLGKLIKQGVLEHKDRGMYRLARGKR